MGFVGVDVGSGFAATVENLLFSPSAAPPLTKSALLGGFPLVLLQVFAICTILNLENAKQTRCRSFVFNAFSIIGVRILSASYYSSVHLYKKNHCRTAMVLCLNFYYLGRQDSNLWNAGTKSPCLTA